jgi:nucleotide-binding universal stress UspA family protein
MKREGGENRPEIRRILVTLDASSQSVKRVEAATELASDLEAELVGLFVEDTNLLRMAELPFVKEFSPFSPFGQRVEARALEREFRAQSARMRRVLASAADARAVPWTFRVARGLVTTEVLLAASEADLIVLGKMTWAPAGVRRMGSTVRMILSQGRSMTMVMQEEYRWTVPISLIYDGSDSSEKGVIVASHLARIRKGGMNVFILAPKGETSVQYRSRVDDTLRDRQVKADFYFIVNPSLNTLAWFLRGYGKGPLVLPCGSGLFQEEALCSFITDIPNPVLLVR